MSKITLSTSMVSFLYKHAHISLIQVDIYSYGLLLYVMMTNGHKPFEELSAGYEIDRAIEEVCCIYL